jgi:hypothetical protein
VSTWSSTLQRWDTTITPPPGQPVGPQDAAGGGALSLKGEPVTTAEVWTTIKEDMPIVGLIGLMLGLLNACFGGGWGGRAIGWTFMLGRAQNLTSLQKRRDLLIRLHDSDREYYGWLLSGCLGALALFALEMMFEGLLAQRQVMSPHDQLFYGSVLSALRYGLGLTAYLITCARLGGYRALQHFDRSIARLDQAMAKLEAKTPLQPAV